MAEPIKIVHEAGGYVVREFFRYACTSCRDGWSAGTLVKPGDGGQPCTHGRGSWQAGTVGKRGGWYGVGPTYRSLLAAQIVCDALDRASTMPAVGRT